MSVYITREMIRHAAHEWRDDNTLGILARLARSVRRKWKRRETMFELRSLTDRELWDIGVYREDIPRVVQQLDDQDLGLVPTPRGAQASGNAVPA